MEDIFSNNNEDDENDEQIGERHFSDADINVKGGDESVESFSSSCSSTVNCKSEREFGEIHINPIDVKESSSKPFPTPSSASTANADQQRQMLILMLLAQVCGMHDSTPKTFTIHVLSLYEKGILDHDHSIEFLFNMGLVPKQLKLSSNDMPVSEFIPVSQSKEGSSTPPLHDKDQSILEESPKENVHAAAIVPYKTSIEKNGKEENDRMQHMRIARIRQVHIIRQHLEKQEPSLKNSRKIRNTSPKQQTEANFSSIRKIIDKSHSSYHQIVTSAASTAERPSLSASWAVEDHPLSLSRYSRDFIQRKPLASGSFGEVFLATNKVDNCDYAVKKIVIAAKGYDTDEVEIVMKEVKCLAKLDHENVVRYYTSWLEPTWVTGSSSASPTNTVDGQNLYKGGNEGHVGVSSPDEVASKDVQKKMLKSIHQLVYGGEGNKFNTDDRFSNNQSEVSIESSIPDENGCGYDEGSCAWSFNNSDCNRSRDVYTLERLPSNVDENNTVSFNSISTGEYGEESEYSEWKRDQQHSSVGNIKVTNQNKYRRKQHSNNNISLNSISTGEYGEESECSEWTNDQQHSSVGSMHVPDLYPYRQKQHSNNKKQEKTYRYQICLFIQMQLCQPLNLADWIRHHNNSENSRCNTLNRKWCSKHDGDAWDVFLQIVRGLVHIHSQGIIHRDLKPANIFSADDGQFKIGDFGLSTMLKTSSSTFSVTDEQAEVVTDNGTMLTLVSRYEQFSRTEMQESLTSGIGTATYAAPEQIVSNSYGAKADIFSLGLILLELFCSFGSEHERAATFHDCRRGKLPSWIVSNSQFKNVAELIISCTKHTPSDRPTANEILKWNIYKEALITKKDITGTNIELELQRRDRVIAEQSRQLLEKDALLKKQTEDLKLLKESMESMMIRSNSKK